MPMEAMMRCLLAIDPGSDKVGVAIVTFAGACGEKTVVYLSELHRTVLRLVREHKPELIVMGGGTAAKATFALLRDQVPEIEIRFGEEGNTTREARTRYWRDHPPSGLWRFIPLGLQTPPGPVDDYAAWIIGERYLQAHGLSESGASDEAAKPASQANSDPPAGPPEKSA